MDKHLLGNDVEEEQEEKEEEEGVGPGMIGCGEAGAEMLFFLTFSHSIFWLLR